MTVSSDSWTRTALCLRLLLSAPGYLPGATLRLRAGPDRDRLLRELTPLKMRRMHPSVTDEQLTGGLDLASMLDTGQVIENKGIFSKPCAIVLTMAERCGPDLAAKIAHQLDRDKGHCLIALDEGADADEAAPPALSERVPFHIQPEGRMPEGWAPVPAGTGLRAVHHVTSTAEHAELLTRLAAQFGIASLRAPLLALRVARTHAALHGRSAVSDTDLEVAASLVYPQRATQAPAPEEAATEPETADGTPQDAPETDGTLELPDGDMLVDAVRAALPPDLLAGLVPAGTTRRSGGDGAGQRRKGNRRGRPLPSRAGRIDGRNRIDLIATLRAAAPWQRLRRAAQPDTSGVLIRPSDIRLKRYVEQSDRLLIFAVDASGSAAVARLNEAKGAIEMLLAEAYAARDHVALVSFRGTSADVLLPPTRSLVQTKRRLAGMPGGGGTPLATGLQQALQLALHSRSKGLTPTLVILTDGRTNIALDGTSDRARAAEDADQIARVIRSQGVMSLVIDTAARPQGALRRLAGQLDGAYLPLPRADAKAVTGAVSAALSR